MGSPRLSFQGLRILRLFLDDPTSELTGAEIISSSGLASGTVYPLLLRFERIGFLESHWEAGNPTDLARPRRRYYRMTGDGRAVIQEAIRDLAPTGALPAQKVTSDGL